MKKEETIIQQEIINFLKIRDWLVINIHGNMYQQGLPDLYCTHSDYGIRWVEIKNPKQYSFTAAQIKMFPKLISHGSGVWVMIAATETEYAKLFKPSNLFAYMMK